MAQTKSAVRLRQMLAEPDKIIVCPGVNNGLTARAALSVGFDALYMSGAGTAASRLGQPDLGRTTADGMATNAGTTAGLDRAVPVVADADAGFGGPLSCRPTPAPPRSTSSRGGRRLPPRGPGRAAKRCGRRASGRRSTGRRRRAKAGAADAAFLEGVRTKGADGAGAREAQELGFKVVIWPIAGMTNVYLGMRAFCRELRSTGEIKDRHTEDGKIDGGVRDVFELCGLEACVRFDEEVGAASFANGARGREGEISLR
ncbi:hypothetical protein Hte_003237 [Hypoxylon texense]